MCYKRVCLLFDIIHAHSNPTVPKEFVENIYNFMQTLLSESNKQQQDLKTIKDDLGLLKLSYAILQGTTSDFNAASMKQLQHIKSTLEYQEEKIGDLEDCLEEHKTNTTEQLNTLQTTVDTIQHPCGTLYEWIEVVNFDMTDNATSCPDGWVPSIFNERTCGRATSNETRVCYPATFTFRQGMLQFSKVCGRVKAYAYGGVDGFQNSRNRNVPISESYVTGVSLTVGANYDEHLWTFVAGREELPDNGDRIDQCPCDASDSSTIAIPEYIGNNYFCEAGVNKFRGGERFHDDDPLWDGLDCNVDSTCCDFNHPPYFINDLGKTITTNAIDARICLLSDGPTQDDTGGDDILIEVLEIYIAP